MVTVPEDAGTSALISAIRDEEVTLFLGLTPLLVSFLQIANPADFKSLDLILAEPGTIPTSLKRQFREKFNVGIHEYYGPIRKIVPLKKMGNPGPCEIIPDSFGRIALGSETEGQESPGLLA